MKNEKLGFTIDQGFDIVTAIENWAFSNWGTNESTHTGTYYDGYIVSGNNPQPTEKNTISYPQETGAGKIIIISVAAAIVIGAIVYLATSKNKTFVDKTNRNQETKVLSGLTRRKKRLPIRFQELR